MSHIHVPFPAPERAHDVAQAGRHENEGAVSVGKCSDGSCAAADLAHEALQGIIGPQAAPVFRGKMEVVERLLDASGDDLGRAGELHLAQLGDHQHGLRPGRLEVLLVMDGLSIAATSRTFEVGTAVHTLR